MKFSAAFTTLVFVLPLFSGQALGQKNNGKGGKQAPPPPPPAQNNTAANNNAAGGDPQTSLTLDPGVISKGFESNGQETPTAGQVASLTSSNNFINFCLTVKNKPLTNGQQVKTGSCNPAPLGVIAATTNMPSAKFQSPVNGQDLAANTAFNINLAIKNLETGNFVNAAANYYSAPQQVNAQGDIIGHSHITCQALPSFTSTQPLDPNVFAFFKGLNDAAVNGVLTTPVAAGLPAGFYRCCTINTDANHTPTLVAVAQHGSLDDCVYFSTGQGNGANVFNGNAGNNTAAGNAGAKNGAAAGNAAGNNAGAKNGTAAGNAAGNNNGAKNGAAAGNAAGKNTGAKNITAAGNAVVPPAGKNTGAKNITAAGNAVVPPAGKGANAGKGAVAPIQGAKQPGNGKGAGGRRMLARLARDH